MELPENRERTFRDSLADCQVSFRSEHDIGIEYEFRHCDLTVIYANNSYYGSHIDFSRLKKISGNERIVKSSAINFWRHFEGYAEDDMSASFFCSNPPRKHCCPPASRPHKTGYLLFQIISNCKWMISFTTITII